MPQPFEKATAETSDIPKPELNPMTNPVLGRHLGRWAEVYFTTPVEQREQAVMELLSELKQVEESGGTETSSAHAEDHRLENELSRSIVEIDRPEDRLAALEEAIRQFEVPRAEPPRLGQSRLSSASDSSREPTPGLCPVCQQSNPPDQWYCGMCGYKLRAEPTSAPRVVPFRQAAYDAGSTEPTRSNDAQPTDGFSFSMFGEPLQTTDANPNVRPLWPLEAVEELPSSGVGAKVAAVCVVLLIAAIGYSSRDRVREIVKPLFEAARSSPTTQTQTSPPPPATAPASNATTDNTTQDATAEKALADEKDSGRPVEGRTAQPSRKNIVPQENTVASTSAERAAVPSSSDDASPSPKAGPSTATPDRAVENASRSQETASLPVEGGNEELSRARELLSGRSKPSDPGQASVWLWKAVGKNNGPAILLLAELYARGSGVPQSCDQARILLSAAAKKGSAEAGQKLKQIQNAQCAGR